MAQIYLEIFLDTFKLVIPGCLIILLPFILILLLLLFFRATLRRLMFFFWGVKVKVQRRNLESKRNNRGELQQDESTKPSQSINLDSSSHVSTESLYSKSFAPQRDEFAEYAAARQRIWLALRKAEARSQREVAFPHEDWFSKPLRRESPRSSQGKFDKQHEVLDCSGIGRHGENFVYSILESSCPNMRFIRNVYLRTGTNSLTEIDLVGISDKGVFVFECKNYNGDVYGTDKKSDWHVYYPSGKSYSFYSPVLQNESHMKAILRKIPWLQSSELHSVIVFVGSGCVRVLASVPVISASSLRSDFKKLESSLSPVLGVHEIQTVYNCLKLFSNPSDDIKREHIRHVSEAKKKYSS